MVFNLEEEDFYKTFSIMAQAKWTNLKHEKYIFLPYTPK